MPLNVLVRCGGKSVFGSVPAALNQHGPVRRSKQLGVGRHVALVRLSYRPPYLRSVWCTRSVKDRFIELN